MDDTEAVLARRVARTASAWLRAPTSLDLYRRLLDAVAEYDAYRDPLLPTESAGEQASQTGGAPPRPDENADDEELLDGLADGRMPQPLGAGLVGLESRLRAAARREL